MKRIKKIREPQDFTQWKIDNPDNHTWDAVDGNIKRIVRGSLITEQGFICCYCEQKITIDNAHVEHFLPQYQRPDLSLDYKNLLASCNGNDDHHKMGLYCAHEKDKHQYIEIVSPLSRICEDRFIYYFNGGIDQSGDDEVARITIIVLGLKNSYLKSLRSAVIDTIFYEEVLVREGAMHRGNMLTLRKIQERAEIYLAKKDDESYNPFYTTINYLCGHLGIHI